MLLRSSHAHTLRTSPYARAGRPAIAAENALQQHFARGCHTVIGCIKLNWCETINATTVECLFVRSITCMGVCVSAMGGVIMFCATCDPVLWWFSFFQAHTGGQAC